MKVLKNAEVRNNAVVLFCFGAACGIICLWLDPLAGKVASAAFLMILLWYLRDATLRYRRMAELAAGLDELLHGGETFNFTEYREGELSLLQNEIVKLTLRMREQADLLRRDKTGLADALADISHQLRTPLTSMNLIVTAMKDHRLPEAKRREHLREMRRLLDRTQWLISALLKMAKLEAGTISLKKERTELSEVVEQASAPFAIAMELKDQHLCTDVSGSFQGDLSWTSEALGNILKNCMEHMDAGTIYVTGLENPLYSQIRVRDTGAGIPAEDLPHLFERFYKGKNSGDQNVGIGLALSRTIITMQNGIIKAENPPEGGAQFTIRFYKGIV